MIATTLKPEIALLEKKINGMILICYENERPLRGMIGYLDWRFNNLFSKLIQNQTLTGKKGECTYIPHRFNQENYHFIVQGAGLLTDSLEESRVRHEKKFLDDALEVMKKLALTQMAVSPLDYKLPKTEEASLWIL